METTTNPALTERSYAGLTATQVVLQSEACHPRWGIADHVGYLVFEEGFTCCPQLVKLVEETLA